MRRADHHNPRETLAPIKSVQILPISSELGVHLTPSRSHQTQLFSTKIMVAKLAAFATLMGLAAAQQVGKETTETHPKMTWQKCNSGGSCTTVNGEVTIDSNWRWVHDKNGYTNCYGGNSWNTTICNDSKSCASNCAVDGADYSGTYGASTSGNALTLKFVTEGEYCEYRMASSRKGSANC